MLQVSDSLAVAIKHNEDNRIGFKLLYNQSVMIVLNTKQCLKHDFLFVNSFGRRHHDVFGFQSFTLGHNNYKGM